MADPAGPNLNVHKLHDGRAKGNVAGAMCIASESAACMRGVCVREAQHTCLQ